MCLLISIFFVFSLLDCSAHTLTSFAQALMQYKEYPNRHVKTFLKHSEFTQAMHNFARAAEKEMTRSPNDWLDQEVPPAINFSLQHDSYFPYVQKMILPEESEIALWGDIHGSAHSFIRSLLKLKKDGYLLDDFSIAPQHNNFYLFFLGDYVDRGYYSLEVLYLLFKLKIANPERVVLIRGNHEDIRLNHLWNFVEELHSKYDNFDLNLLQRIYNLMPMALYFGCPSDSQKINFIMCCHGGPEFGFDPHNLLSADQHICFQQVKLLKRHSYFKDMFNKGTLNLPISSRTKLVATMLSSKEKLQLEQDIDIQKSSLRHIGFLWNDFNAHTNDNDFIARIRSWMFGKNITQLLLSWGESETSCLRGIFRGHQHTKSMYPELWTRKGKYKLWDGKVYTLFSSPAADMADPMRLKGRNNPHRFFYDTFFILTTNTLFSQWTLSHWYQERVPNERAQKDDNWHVIINQYQS